MKEQSFLMTFLRGLGFDSIAWSLRRLHVPVSKNALVLEVGSGGNPYFRSNVLVDAYEETRERHWVPLIKDRPTVLAYGERLPFKDKVFDFVIASHVLEHSTDPRAFLQELQRVARAGYIEVPNAFFDRICPYPDHRLEIRSVGGQLIIKKKTQYISDKELLDLYLDSAMPAIAHWTMPKFPFHFHVRFYWQDKIPFVIKNENEHWVETEAPSQGAPETRKSMVARIKGMVLRLWAALFTQRSRNARLDISGFFQCISCSGTLKLKNEVFECSKCSMSFRRQNGVVNFCSPNGPSQR